VSGAQTQACYAVYGADGSVRVAPTAFDAAGDTNAGMSIVALDTGGFAIAYEDSGWAAGPHDISFARFDAGGALLGRTRATSLTGTDSQASLTALSNSMVALSYAVGGDGGSGIQLQLIDPATGNPLLAAPLVIADTAAGETDPSAAAWGLAGVAVAFKGGGFDLGAHRLVRTSGGDAADDLIVGDDAVDRFDGGDGADTLSGLANADALDGGNGDDVLSGGAGQDVLEGGFGLDTADYAGGAAVRVDLGVAGFQNTGGAGFDRLAGIENLVGGAAADRLTGDASDNRLDGRDGGDTLSAGAGADTLDGGAGADNLSGGAHDDRVLGGAGADAMSGGDGVDTLDYAMFAAATFLDLSATGVQNTRSAGSDTLIGFENVLTGGGADRVFGSGLGNRLETAGGADTIKAKGGSDLILSGAGDDVVSAGGGADTLVGGHGVDVLRGGAQADVFHFGPYTDSAVGLGLCDVIRDFRTSDGDRIDLGEVFGGGELIFIGAAAFTGFSLQQEVRVGVVAEGQLIQVDLTGDGVSEMDILVSNGGLAGGAADFIL
jgi:Ca2+-binding RTX toxin-like protein